MSKKTASEKKFTTTDAGSPVSSDEHSLSIGPDRPLVLREYYLIEQMANFNRERVPERQPLAKGGGGFGRFEVTHGVSKYTKASVFQPGTHWPPEGGRIQTPVLERAIAYWRNVDANLGNTIADGVS